MTIGHLAPSVPTTPADTVVAAPRRRTPSQRVIFPFAGAILLFVGIALWTPVLIGSPAAIFPEPAWYAILALVAAFVVGEVLPLKFEVRRETILVSLSELPLVIGLLLMPVWIVGAAYLVAGLVAFGVRRDTWRSNFVNIALIAVESGIAALVLLLARPTVVSGELLEAAGDRFLPVAAGVLAGALVSAISVGITYRLTGLAEPLAKLVLRSMYAATIIVGCALVGFTVWNAPVGGPYLGIALLAVIAVLYRNYATFLRQHADLARLYAFGSRVRDSATDDEALQGLLLQVSEQLNSAVAALYLLEDGDDAGIDGIALALAVGATGPIQVTMPLMDDALLVAAARDSTAHATAERVGDALFTDALASRGAWEVMTVALTFGGRHRGFLEVWDRRSRFGRFNETDLQVLSTLGGHLATAMDNHRLVRRLRYAAYHDPVTGLFNRLGLRRSLEGSLEPADADGSRDSDGSGSIADGMDRAGFGGLALLELDVLSDVTSALGYERGDQLLATVAERIADAAGGPGLVGRIDADRFAVLIESADEAAAEALVNEIVTAASRPVIVEGMEIEPTVTVGVAMCANGDVPENGELILQQAQLALQSARSKDQHVLTYRPAIGELYQRRFQLISQFRAAVDTGRVTVHFQPKVTLAERELIGVEALVRWMHPEYGFVSPAELIDAIESTSAIDVLFRHVLDLSLAQIADWSARNMRIGVAVNLSVRNLLADDFTATVTDALTRHGVSPELLTLELTESSVMEQPERSMPVLRALHDAGIGLSVDDFGTGYSSLAYLRRLPIDEIKIDRSFVQGMVTDLGDLAIVRAIIDLGHSLGLRVVAEGVEEEAGRDALRSMRCDAMQGFLLARPLPIDRFETWLASRAVSTEHALGGASLPLRIRV